MHYLFYRISAHNIILLFLTIFMLAPSFFGPQSVYAEEVGLALPEAINVAGRQRMLTQRMMKLYCIIGLNINVDKNKKEMNAVASLFEKQLKQLEHIEGVNNTLISKHLKHVYEYWEPVKNMIALRPSLDGASILRHQTDELLKYAHDFVVALEGVSATSQGKLVNISGRQRMLSQRIASFYIQSVWGVKSESVEGKSKQAKVDFDKAIKLLKAATENTPELDYLLGLVGAQWQVFRAINTLGIYTKNNDYAQPALVSDSSDKILSLMNEVTHLYASL